MSQNTTNCRYWLYPVRSDLSITQVQHWLSIQHQQRIKIFSFRAHHLTLRVLFFRCGASFCTWRARVPKPNDCRDSVTKRCVGETHSISNSLASPPGGWGEEQEDSKISTSNGEKSFGYMPLRFFFFFHLWELTNIFFPHSQTILKFLR